MSCHFCLLAPLSKQSWSIWGVEQHPYHYCSLWSLSTLMMGAVATDFHSYLDSPRLLFSCEFCLEAFPFRLFPCFAWPTVETSATSWFVKDAFTNSKHLVLFYLCGLSFHRCHRAAPQFNLHQYVDEYTKMPLSPPSYICSL